MQTCFPSRSTGTRHNSPKPKGEDLRFVTFDNHVQLLKCQ